MAISRLIAVTEEQRNSICAECHVQTHTACPQALPWYRIDFVDTDSHGYNHVRRTMYKRFSHCAEAAQFVANLNKARGYPDAAVMENGEVDHLHLHGGDSHVKWYGPFAERSHRRWRNDWMANAVIVH